MLHIKGQYGLFSFFLSLLLEFSNRSRLFMVIWNFPFASHGISPLICLTVYIVEIYVLSVRSIYSLTNTVSIQMAQSQRVTQYISDDESINDKEPEPSTNNGNVRN